MQDAQTNVESATSRRLDLLRQLTQIPTAAGREQGVMQFIREWAAARPGLDLREDSAGNMVISIIRRGTKGRGRKASSGRKASPPLFITAHLDHPAFVVERVDAQARRIELSFRGGVNDIFFEHAPITIHTPDGPLGATVGAKASAGSPAGDHYLAELDDPMAIERVVPGAIGTWAMPNAEIDADGILHTPACDDLAAAAAALAAMDDLLAEHQAGAGGLTADVRLLFTRSEEIGFIGAIAACKLGTIPRGSRLLALENSRAFPESPVGGGPIVRVGDRLTIFTPWLTAACARRAEEIFGGPDTPRASQTSRDASKRPWQRKLMSGGACEASVFCHAGFDATCLCLPLGNYHNMPHLDKIQSGTYDATVLGPPRCEREFIHTRDYLGLVDLLVALGQRLPEPGGDFGKRLDKMYAERAYVLGASIPQNARSGSRRGAQGAAKKKATEKEKRRGTRSRGKSSNPKARKR